MRHVSMSSPFAVEPLESRVLLSGTIVQFETVMGAFQVELFDDAAPATVANFLSYVNDGAYDSTIVHRTVPGLVVQGGGFTPTLEGIETDDPIPLEAGISNTRGTIAMARGLDPDSATSQWFINLADNPGLDPNPGLGEPGFAVFGQVLGDGMDVIDAIGELPRVNLGAPFAELPVMGESEDLVVVNSVEVVTPVGADELTVTIGAGLPRTARFTDPDGTVATIHLRGRLGTADLRFTGDSLQETIRAGRIVVTGQNVRLEEINATGTNFRTSLVINAAGGDGAIEVESITTDGSLSALRGPNVNVTGDVTVAGGLRRLTLGNVRGSNILITNGGRNGLTIRLGEVQDTTLTSFGFIRGMTAMQWLRTMEAQSWVVAPRIRQLNVLGDFDAELNMTAVDQQRALGTIRIGGQLGPSPWILSGNAHQLLLTAVSPEWQAAVDGRVERVRIADAESQQRFGDQITQS